MRLLAGQTKFKHHKASKIHYDALKILPIIVEMKNTENINANIRVKKQQNTKY